MVSKFILEIKHAFNSDGKEQVGLATQGEKRGAFCQKHYIQNHK